MIENAINVSDRLWDSNLGQGVVTYVSVSLTGSGDLVAAVTGKRIRVIGLMMVASAAMTFKLQSDSSTDLTGVMTMTTGVPISWVPRPKGYTQTNVGEKLACVITGVGTIAGTLIYAAF
jgi:hypothetical protein